MAYGITPEGFKAKTLQEIQTEIKSRLRSEISQSLDLSTPSPMGQIVGVFASSMREAWELAQAVYSAGSILTATGFPLDLVAANTGAKRDGATKSQVEATVNLNAGVTLPLGTVASVDGDSTARFVTLAAVTNGGGVPADFTVQMESESFGPVVANAGTLTTLVDSVVGWNSITNVEDATEGQLQESDASLKAKQRAERAANGSGSIPGLRAALLQVDGIQSAKVFENVTGQFVGIQPPYTIECVIFDGPSPVVANDDIAQVIWNNKAGGAITFGLVTGVATDVEGDPHDVLFSRPSVLDIYLEIDVKVSPQLFPTDGQAQIQQAVADYGDENLGVGDDVILSALCQPIFDVPGVIDITGTRVGEAASPTQTTNYTISAREFADLDTGRIVVNLV